MERRVMTSNSILQNAIPLNDAELDAVTGGATVPYTAVTAATQRNIALQRELTLDWFISRSSVE
jgi:hypothetical protein